MPVAFGFGPLEAEAWRFLFAMARIGAALAAAPLFGAGGVAPQVRVALAGAIAALVTAWTPLAAPPPLLSLAGAFATLGEVAIGLALGFVLQLAFAAPLIAAELIGGGMGMGMAAAADPVNGAPAPVLGHMFSAWLTLVFFGLGGHLAWIALIVRSYRVLPPGAGWGGLAQAQALAGFATEMFAFALIIALPVALVLLLVQLASAVVSRAAPSLNLFALGLPAGVLAGLAALVAAAPLMTDRCAELSLAALRVAAEALGR